MAEIRTEDIFGAGSLKPNSNLSKESKDIPEERDKLPSVVTGKTRKKKEKGFKRYLKAFIDENVEEIVGSDPDGIKVSIFKVLIPGTKKLILDIGNSILYKGGRSPYSKKASSVSWTSYSNSYDNGYSQTKRQIEEKQNRPMTVRDYDNVVFDNRGDAERVLAAMEEIIAMSGIVTVAQFYDLAEVEEDVSWTTNKFGWKSVKNARISRDADEYCILLPKAMPLE